MSPGQVAYLNGPESVHPNEYELPTPTDSDVLAENVRANVCGSELHIRRGEHPHIDDGVLGHEALCRVIETGDDVRDSAGTPSPRAISSSPRPLQRAASACNADGETHSCATTPTSTGRGPRRGSNDRPWAGGPEVDQGGDDNAVRPGPTQRCPLVSCDVRRRPPARRPRRCHVCAVRRRPSAARFGEQGGHAGDAGPRLATGAFLSVISTYVSVFASEPFAREPAHADSGTPEDETARSRVPAAVHTCPGTCRTGQRQCSTDSRETVRLGHVSGLCRSHTGIYLGLIIDDCLTYLSDVFETRHRLATSVVRQSAEPHSTNNGSSRGFDRTVSSTRKLQSPVRYLAYSTNKGSYRTRKWSSIGS